MIDTEKTNESDELAAWQELRRTGMGGTDVAALFGASFYRSPIDVWLEKVGEAETFPGNERTKWGNLLEPVVAADYAEENGLVVLQPSPKTLRHPARSWQLGSPDRLCYTLERLPTDGGPVPTGLPRPGDWTTTMAMIGAVRDKLSDQVKMALAQEVDSVLRMRPDHGLEIKTHGFRAAFDYGDAGTDDVPDDKRIQSAWYQSLMDLQRWDLVALFDTHIVRTFVIERDQEMEDYMLEEVERFWTRHVVPRVEPDPDGTASFTRYLAKRFDSHDDVILGRSPESDELANQLREIRIQGKKLELQRELVEQQLKSWIGDHRGVEIADGKRIQWKETRSGRLYDKDLRLVLYERAGLTDDEIRELEAEHAMPSFRKLYTPQWTRGITIDTEGQP